MREPLTQLGNRHRAVLRAVLDWLDQREGGG